MHASLMSDALGPCLCKQMYYGKQIGQRYGSEYTKLVTVAHEHQVHQLVAHVPLKRKSSPYPTG